MNKAKFLDSLKPSQNTKLCNALLPVFKGFSDGCEPAADGNILVELLLSQLEKFVWSGFTRQAQWNEEIFRLVSARFDKVMETVSQAGLGSWFYHDGELYLDDCGTFSYDSESGEFWGILICYRAFWQTLKPAFEMEIGSVEEWESLITRTIQSQQYQEELTKMVA